MEDRSKASSYKALTLLWALVCAVLLLVPSADLPGQEWSGIVKAAIEIAVHIGLFFVLAWLAANGFSAVKEAIESSAVALPADRKTQVFAVVLAYCLLLEILQIPVPGRNFELLDLVAGGLGAVVGSWRPG